MIKMESKSFIDINLQRRDAYVRTDKMFRSRTTWLPVFIFFAQSCLLFTRPTFRTKQTQIEAYRFTSLVFNLR